MRPTSLFLAISAVISSVASMPIVLGTFRPTASLENLIENLRNDPHQYLDPKTKKYEKSINFMIRPTHIRPPASRVVKYTPVTRIPFYRNMISKVKGSTETIWSKVQGPRRSGSDKSQSKERVRREVQDHSEDDHGFENHDPSRKGEYNHPHVPDRPGGKDDSGGEHEDPSRKGEYKHPPNPDYPEDKSDHGGDLEDPTRKGEFIHPKVPDRTVEGTDYGDERHDPRRKGEYKHPPNPDNPGAAVDYGFEVQGPKKEGKHDTNASNQLEKFVDYGFEVQGPKRKGKHNSNSNNQQGQFVDYGFEGQGPRRKGKKDSNSSDQPERFIDYGFEVQSSVSQRKKVQGH